MNPSALKLCFKRYGLKQRKVLFSLENSESVRKYIGYAGMCRRVGFLRRFGLKTGIVFEGTTGVYERIIVSISNE